MKYLAGLCRIVGETPLTQRVGEMCVWAERGDSGGGHVKILRSCNI